MLWYTVMGNKILKSTRNKSKNGEMITQNQQVSRQQGKQATGSRDTDTTKGSFTRAASSQRLEELYEMTQQQNKDSNQKRQ